MLFWPRRASVPRTMSEATERIRTAAVALKPYPHFVLYDALPAAEFDLVKAAWPARETMWHEDGHDRYWAYAERPDSAWHSEPWASIKTEIVNPMFAAIGERMLPFFKARYAGDIELEPRLLALHEAGGGFVEHQRHTHFEHNPRYAFTVLFCVEDDGFRGRGTTLYGYHNLPQKFAGDDDDTLMHMASGQLFTYARPDVVVPFVPNRLLVFIDGPMSIHGSTPFTRAGGARRMILSHVTERTAEREVSSADCVQQFIDYRNGGAIADWMRPILAKERAVIRAWG